MQATKTPTTLTAQQQTQTQTAQTTGVAVPQQGSILQIPPAFVRLRQRRQIVSVSHCPRCGESTTGQNAVFCAGCGLPLYGCPCPSCQNTLEYYPNHIEKKKGYREVFWCPYCGSKLEWEQSILGGEPAHLIFYKA